MALRSVEGEHRFHSQTREFVERVLEGFDPTSSIRHWERRTEKPCGTVIVRGMDLADKHQIQTYINFLWDPRNRLHFAHPPEDVRELRELARNPRNHFLVATRVEKDNRGRSVERVVGGAQLTDNASPENDHWISLVVVDPKKQGQGVGKKLIRGIVEWSLGHKTFEKRDRDQLHLAINLGIEGWERMEKLVKSSGFKFFQTIGKEVDYWEITEPNGEVHLEHVNLKEQDKLEWREVQKDGVTVMQAQRSDGSVIEVVKKATRRYLFRYVVDINKDHPSWQHSPADQPQSK